MKKLFITLLAAAGVLAACDKIEKITLPAGDDVTPPVLLSAPETIVVTEDNGDETADFAWLSANFKTKVAATYSLYGKYGGKTASIVSLPSVGNVAGVSYTAFNKGLLTAFPEIVPGKPTDVEFMVGVTIGNTYDTIYSNAMTVKVTAAPLKDRDTDYPDYADVSTWGVTGAVEAHELNWGNPKDGKTVPDLVMYTDGTWHLCEKVTLKTTDMFKFRENNKWDNNFGASGDVEPFVVELGVEIEANGGGKNLAVGEDGDYDLFLDPDAKKIKVVKHGSGGGGGGDVEELDIPDVKSVYFATDEGNTDLNYQMTGEKELTISNVIAGTEPFPVLIHFDLPKDVTISAVDKGADMTDASIVAEGKAVAFWVPSNEGEARTLEGTVSFAGKKLKGKLTVKILQKGAGDVDPDPIEYSHPFVSGDFGIDTGEHYPAEPLKATFDNVEWTLAETADDGQFFQYVTSSWYANSIQVGYGWSGAGCPKEITLSTESIAGKVTKIVFRYVTFDDTGNHYVASATVGGADFGTPVAHVNEAGSATFEGEASGKIVVKLTQDPADCACFLKGIDVTYIPAA